MVYIVMGVSGCGKTTVGKILAKRFALPFYDADDFHSATSVAKMKAGIPLSDEDRIPWLEDLAHRMPLWHQEGGAVLACSALKQKYRDVLRGSNVETAFVYLHGDRKLILGRMNARTDHFMPTDLLESQLESLEEPQNCLSVDISASPEEIVDTIVQHLKQRSVLQ